MNRTCRGCGNEFPIEKFPLAGITKGVRYRRHLCAGCYGEQKRQQKRKQRRAFWEFKKTLECAHCGLADYRVLEFHYVSGEKERELSNLVEAPKKFQEELKKCIVLCANCHRILHHVDYPEE